jgi:hypothetical protein
MSLRRSEDVVVLHTLLLEKQDASVSAILDARLWPLDRDDRDGITDASFLVKTLLERREQDAAAFVLGAIRAAVGRRHPLHALQLNYAEGLMAFELSAPAEGALRALAPEIVGVHRPRERDEFAFAIAILWRAALLQLHLGRHHEAWRNLSQADGLARELGDPTMLGVVATARGWYSVKLKDWCAARAAFLGGLLLVDYNGRPRRLWADLALGLAYLELNAPESRRMKTFDVQCMLDKCADEIGKLRPYPMYVNGRGCLDPMRLASQAYVRGHSHRRRTRHIPVAIRSELEKRQAFGCRWCGKHGELAIDHVWFFSWGGTAGSPRRLNVRWLCRTCNRARSDRFMLDSDAYRHLLAI